MPAGPLPEIVDQIISWLAGPERLADQATPVPQWSGEDWQLFKKVTFIHGVAPILSKKLEDGRLPSKIHGWLQSQFDNNSQRISRIQSDLASILSTFARSNVPVMPLKGAVLSALYYQDIALRPTADIDLLIHPQDFTRSTHLLAQLGYEIEKSNWKHAILSRPDNRAIVSYEVEHPENPRRLDLHIVCQELFSGPSVDITANLWATARQTQLLGQPAYIPTPDMLYLHLLLHTSSNIWNGVLRLINLVDLTQVSSPTPNTSFATTIDPRFIYPALHYSHRYLPQPFIRPFLQHCETNIPPSFKRWFAAQNIISRSRLSRESRLSYLAKVLILYLGQPKDLLIALRFLSQNFPRRF